MRAGHDGDRVAIAVSGGPDSVALTWILHTLAADSGPEIAGVIHVNHLLRGAESDTDEASCRALANRLYAEQTRPALDAVRAALGEVRKTGTLGAG